MEIINVACASDEAYTPGLAVTVRSLLENTQSRVELWIVDGGIHPQTKQKLLDSWEGFPIEVHFIQPDFSAIKDLKVYVGNNFLTYARLLLPKHVQIGRLIYLDSDLLIRTDIKELFKTDLGDYVFGAVQDLGCLTVSDPKNGLRNYVDLGIAADHPYCNSGMLLMDMERWIEEGISERVIEYVATHHDIVRWSDQDGLNAAASDRWLRLDPSWNSLIGCSDTLNWSADDIPEKILKPFQAEPKIVHFIGPNKPWRPNCTHPHAAEFTEVFHRTAFHPLQRFSQLRFENRQKPSAAVSSYR